jgi:hypothetical protein
MTPIEKLVQELITVTESDDELDRINTTISVEFRETLTKFADPGQLPQRAV